MFGVSVESLSPVENVYLKIFHALAAGKPSDTAGFLRAYIRAYPDEVDAVQAVVHDALLGQALPDAPELWLANEAMQTGTSLFDQFRALPRTHTFDANAASTFDWLTVPGVTQALAADLVRAAPYRRLDDLMTIPGLPAALRIKVREMAVAMDGVLARAQKEEASLSLSTVVMPYLWRLAALVILASVAGGWLARRSGIHRWWTAGLIALFATLLVLGLAWVITGPAWVPYAAPVIVGGLPAALWRLFRRRPFRHAAAILGAWAMAAIPAAFLSRAWF